MTGKQKQNRGKLWDRYTNSSKTKNNPKRTERAKSPSDSESVGTTVSTLSECVDDTYDQAMETSRSFLLYNSEQSDAVSMHWEKTFHYRHKYVLTTSGNLTDILQDWPIITKPIGTELVSRYY